MQKFHWSKKATWILISGLIVIGIGVAVYFAFFRNTFSKENIVVQISGPTEAVAGKEVSWLVTIKNKNEITIEDINLTFNYPSGVFNSDGSLKKKEKKIIKTIPGGEEKSVNFSGIIFGSEDEIKKAKVSIKYHPKSLSTFFENNATFSTRISETSILFSMNAPNSVDPGQPFSISFSWQSVFSFPLENVQIRLSPPEGFEQISSKLDNERKEGEKIIFDLGSLNEGEGASLKIDGKINGNVGEEKLFRADFGIFDDVLYEFTSLAAIKKVITVYASTLDVFLQVNGDSDYIASPGENLAFMLNFSNTGKEVYRNLSLTAELESDVLDFTTLEAPGGTVEGKKVNFTSKNFPDLLFLGPYGQGSVGFNVKVKDYDSSFSKENGLIKANITFGTIQKSFQIKVSSKTSLNEQAYLALNELPTNVKAANIFTLPENVPLLEKGKDNFFVINFHLDNKGNKLRNAKIVFTLPQEVSFENKVFPQNLNINFDTAKREITLNIGNIGAKSSQDYFLQFKINPQSLPQQIHNEIKLTGQDVWTGKNFEISLPSQTTDSL